MNLLLENKNNISIITIDVEVLDINNLEIFKKSIEPILEKNKDFIFNLEKINFIDSSTLGAFLSCLRTINNKKGDLKLCNMHKNIRAIFELVRMHKIFEIYNDIEEALQSFE